MTAEPKWGFNSPDDRKRVKEDKVVFVNRRAQMYGEFSEALNPTTVNKELPRYAISSRVPRVDRPAREDPQDIR